MLGSGVEISMYYVLAAGLRAVLEGAAGLDVGWAHQISCGVGLVSGLAFR